VEVRGDVEATAMATAKADLAAVAASEFADLERLWYAVDWPPGSRVELIDGELVVSPTGSVWHSEAVYCLTVQLVKLAERRNWVIHTNLTAYIPPTKERLIPDLMVAPRDAQPYGECELFASEALLVAEVVSPWSRRRDREVKPRAYAQAGVPLYMLIDRFHHEPTVTLFSQPSEDGYGERQVAAAGEPLRLPKPFGIALDTARLLG
jgi:Uma2 family endonuclease